MNYIEAMKKRTSVRSYTGETMKDSDSSLIEKWCKVNDNPFDIPIRMELVKVEIEGKLGTYGVIKGANVYICSIVDKADRDSGGLEAIGYAMEKLILKAAAADLGTCWMGGTFKRTAFAKGVGLKNDEVMPAVIPIGYPRDKRRLLDRTMRKMAGSDKRVNFEENFFRVNFDNQLSRSDAGVYELPLEMVRTAPSASNGQPWRIIMTDDFIHFYIDSSGSYPIMMKKIDIGIAMCHFELSAKQLNLDGKWIKEDDADKKDGMTYIVSWVK